MEINKATLELTPKGNCRATRFSKSLWYNTLNGFWETITILTFSKDLHLNFQLLVHRLPEPREITIPSTYHCSRFIIHIIVFEWQTIIQHQLLPTNEKTTTITTRYKWLFYFLHHISPGPSGPWNMTSMMHRSDLSLDFFHSSSAYRSVSLRRIRVDGLWIGGV